MEELEQYYNEFLQIPTYTRKKQLYTFETYVNSRNAGFAATEIYKHFKMEA